jgi:hypothetical protein
MATICRVLVLLMQLERKRLQMLSGLVKIKHNNRMIG